MIQLGIKYLQQTFKYCDRLDTPWLWSLALSGTWFECH